MSEQWTEAEMAETQKDYEARGCPPFAFNRIGPAMTEQQKADLFSRASAGFDRVAQINQEGIGGA